jgi:hypothetical protein
MDKEELADKLATDPGFYFGKISKPYIIELFVKGIK